MVGAEPVAPLVERGPQLGLGRVEQAQAFVRLAESQPQRRGDLGLRRELRVDARRSAVEQRGDRDRPALGARIGRAEHVAQEGVHALGLRRLEPRAVALGFRDAGLAANRQEAGGERRRERQRRDGRHGERGAVLAYEAPNQLAGRVAVGAHELAGLETPQVDGQLRGRRVAARGKGVHRLVDDRDELARSAGLPRGERGVTAGGGRREHLLDRGAGVRRHASEQVVEHRAERVDVGPLVDGLAAGLLRRHVGGRAEHRPDARLVRSAGHGRARAAVLCNRRAAQVLRQAPVHEHGLPERAHEHVRRLEVAVDDALAVGVRDRLRHREQVGQEREPSRQVRRRADERVERAARDELHRVERRAVGPAAGLVDRDDRGVLEPRGDERLAHEARRLRSGPGLQLLERDGAAEPQVARREDAAHAAARELALDRVGVARHERQLGEVPRRCARGDGLERRRGVDRRLELGRVGHG